MSFSPDYSNYKNASISCTVEKAVTDLRSIMGNTMDLNVIFIRIREVPCAVVTIEGMTSNSAMSELIYHPLMEQNKKSKAQAREIFEFLTQESILAAERKTIFTYGEAVQFLFSGFALILTDGIGKGVVYGIQGYDKRSVSAPENEQTIHASQDSFTETIRTNLSLVRRRMKTPQLRFEMMQIGEKSSTDVCMLYLCGRADRQMVDDIRKRLSGIKLDTIMTGEYIQPFIDDSYEKSIFSAIMTTERPDMVCTRLNQGKVCIMVDGTPFCLIVPTLFVENFQTMDDFCEKSISAAMQRWMKYLAFFLAVAFPGLYTAMVMFHPEFFTLKLLLNLSASEEATPYPLTMEMIVITLLFEIIREGGLRLPKPVGSAASIIGGLIIGDAAVKSGIISAPLLIVVGITAAASFVVPSLYPAVSILRLIYILAGGFAGLFGISVCTIVLIANVCAMNDFSISFTSPVIPLSRENISEAAGRASFKTYEKNQSSIKKFKEQAK